jgi:hypothetical protein
VGTPAAAIQAAIDNIAKRGGGVVHFAQGAHTIDRTLVVPANAAIRLIGEGINNVSRLDWTGAGAGPILKLNAPSRALVENLALFGATRADGVTLDGLDAAGGPLLLDQVKAAGCTEAGFQIERTNRTSVILRDIDHAGCGVGMRLSGAKTQVLILSGSSSDNDLSYVLGDGARLLARDIWYESNAKPR